MTWRPKAFDAQAASAAQIQAVFGLSEGALREAVADGLPVLPRAANGLAHRFNCAEVHAWLLARRAEEARQPDSPAAELSRLRRSQRELIELQTAQRRQALIPAREAVDAWAWIRATFRARMARVMDDAAARGWPPHVLDELAQSIAEALAELRADPLATGNDISGSKNSGNAGLPTNRT